MEFNILKIRISYGCSRSRAREMLLQDSPKFCNDVPSRGEVTLSVGLFGERLFLLLLKTCRLGGMVLVHWIVIWLRKIYRHLESDLAIETS